MSLKIIWKKIFIVSSDSVTEIASDKWDSEKQNLSDSNMSGIKPFEIPIKCIYQKIYFEIIKIIKNKTIFKHTSTLSY